MNQKLYQNTENRLVKWEKLVSELLEKTDKMNKNEATQKIREAFTDIHIANFAIDMAGVYVALRRDVKTLPPNKVLEFKKRYNHLYKFASSIEIIKDHVERTIKLLWKNSTNKSTKSEEKTTNKSTKSEEKTTNKSTKSEEKTTNKDLFLASFRIKKWLDFVQSIEEHQLSLHDFEELSKDLQTAKEKIDAELKIDPKDKSAIFYLSQYHLCYALAKDGGPVKEKQCEVKNHMEKVVELAPDKPKYRYMLGMMYSNYGDTHLAIEQLKIAVEIDPDNQKYINELERLKNSNSDNCFIATAVYENKYSPEVQVLRSFRDNYLLTLKFGIGHYIVKFYYFFSPIFVMHINQKKYIKKLIRVKLLDPIVSRIEKLQKISSTIRE